jgi:hypothetical protein
MKGPVSSAALREEIKELHTLLVSEGDRTRKLRDDIRACMSYPLPPDSADLTLLVQCIDRLQELVRCDQENRAATRRMLNTVTKRQRREGWK